MLRPSGSELRSKTYIKNITGTLCHTLGCHRLITFLKANCQPTQKKPRAMLIVPYISLWGSYLFQMSNKCNRNPSQIYDTISRQLAWNNTITHQKFSFSLYTVIIKPVFEQKNFWIFQYSKQTISFHLEEHKNKDSNMCISCMKIKKAHSIERNCKLFDWLKIIILT